MAFHNQSRGSGQKEIAHIKGGLHQASLKAGNCERLHEVANQDVIEIVRNAPQEEKCGDEDEGNDIFSGKEWTRGKRGWLTQSRFTMIFVNFPGFSLHSVKTEGTFSSGIIELTASDTGNLPSLSI